jgi:PHD/YefM family antitoxin component YafN of YafNO toxin-antitoxin module
MAEEKELKEAQVAYGTAPKDVTEPIILKRDGQPVFAVLPFEEYQRLRDMAERAQAKAETSWKERFDRLLADIHSRPTQYSPEEIEAEITAARAEVKEMRRARRGDC